MDEQYAVLWRLRDDQDDESNKSALFTSKNKEDYERCYFNNTKPIGHKSKLHLGLELDEMEDCTLGQLGDLREGFWKYKQHFLKQVCFW